MIKKFAFILFNLILFCDYLLNKLFRRRIIIFFKEFIDEKLYTKVIIEHKEVLFFTPNQLTNWRVETYFQKEPDTLEWIRGFKKNKCIFWDIGSNIGLYSIFASILHKDISIICFEPSTSNLRILSRNISINNLENIIKINPIALTNKENVFLNMNEKKFIEGGALNTFGEEFDSNGKIFTPKNKYKTFGTTIDYLVENNILEIPNYIKIDVDGIEHLILNGGIKTLKNTNLQSILVEVNEDFQNQKKEIIKIMDDCKFILLSKKMSPLFNLNKVHNYIFCRKY